MRGFICPRMKLSKIDIAAKVAEVTSLSRKDAQDAVDAVFTEIRTQVGAGQEVSIYGFGVFSAVDTPERVAHNPKNLEKVTVPAGRKVRFKVSSTFKNALKVA